MLTPPEQPRLTLMLTVAIFVAAVAWRAAAPSDLYDNDQPLTVTYTMDIVANGRWALPYDVSGNPATKPPMVNWVGAAAVRAAGPLGTTPFVLRLPAVLSGMLIVGLTAVMGRWLMRRDGLPAGTAWAVGLLAGSLWVAASTGMKFIYLMRPDGMLAAWLTGAWACATVLMLRDERRSCWLAAGFWLCVAGGMLTKGPVALIAVAYVVLAAKLLTGRWRAVSRVQWWWGAPLAAAIVGAWVGAAWSADAAGFRQRMIGDVVTHRSTSGGLGAVLYTIVSELWRMPLQFVGRFAPWSIFFILTLLHWPPRKWFRGEIGAIVLWVVLVVSLIMLSPRQRPDYLAPCYGPAAIGAAYWLVVVGAKYRLTVPRMQLVALAIVMGMGAYYAYFNDAARTRVGANVVQFADAVEQVTGGDRMAFLDTGENTLQAQLGYNQLRPPPNAETDWVIRPVDSTGPAPLLVSRPLPGWPDDQTKVLGLYRVPPAASAGGATGRPTIDRAPE